MTNSPPVQAADATAHLMSSPANAQRLQESIAQLERGEGQERELQPPMPDDVTAMARRVRFRLALTKIERDVLVSGLTDEEIDSLVATLAPAAPVEGMVERLRELVSKAESTYTDHNDWLDDTAGYVAADTALRDWRSYLPAILAILDKPQGVGDNAPLTEIDRRGLDL